MPPRIIAFKSKNAANDFRSAHWDVAPGGGLGYQRKIEGEFDYMHGPNPSFRVKTLLPILILLAGLARAGAAGAEASWSQGELWDMCRLGHLEAVKAAII